MKEEKHFKHILGRCHYLPLYSHSMDRRHEGLHCRTNVYAAINWMGFYAMSTPHALTNNGPCSTTLRLNWWLLVPIWWWTMRIKYVESVAKKSCVFWWSACWIKAIYFFTNGPHFAASSKQHFPQQVPPFRAGEVKKYTGKKKTPADHGLPREHNSNIKQKRRSYWCKS